MKKEKGCLTSRDFVFNPKIHAKWNKSAVHPVTGELMPPRSLTVPDEAVSLKKLVEFAMRNNVLPAAAPFGSYGNVDFDSPDLEKMKFMDEVDRGEAIDMLSEQLAVYERQLNILARNSTAARVAVTDQMKSIMDRLDKLSERDPGKEEGEKP